MYDKVRNFYQRLRFLKLYNKVMNYKEHNEYSLDYIESNLKAELKLTDLAKAAGYSEYHFLRVFKQVLRLTPADYIRKRREIA